jgi:hypothetical protein
VKSVTLQDGVRSFLRDEHHQCETSIATPNPMSTILGSDLQIGELPGRSSIIPACQARVRSHQLGRMKRQRWRSRCGKISAQPGGHEAVGGELFSVRHYLETNRF